MGYYVDMCLSNVVIKKANVAKALKAVNDLFLPENIKKNVFMGGNSYSWVANHSYNNLPDAISNWRYGCLILDNGDIEIDSFNGEKLGDDNIFWKALAPFVSSKSMIECVGGDDYHWRWTFKNKKLIEEEGKICY
jgi:hypothetical protein